MPLVATGTRHFLNELRHSLPEYGQIPSLFDNQTGSRAIATLGIRTSCTKNRQSLIHAGQNPQIFRIFPDTYANSEKSVGQMGFDNSILENALANLTNPSLPKPSRMRICTPAGSQPPICTQHCINLDHTSRSNHHFITITFKNDLLCSFSEWTSCTQISPNSRNTQHCGDRHAPCFCSFLGLGI